MSGFFGGAGIGPQAIGRSGAPPDPVPVAGASPVGDPGFDNAGYWTEEAGSSVAAGVAAWDGTQTSAAIYKGSILTIGIWYQINFDIITRNTGAFGVAVGNSAVLGISAVPGANKFFVQRCAGHGSLAIYGVASGGNPNGTCDNLYAYPLTVASLFSARAYASADCDLSAAVTRTAGTQAGLCARLDSASSPANFLIAYLDAAATIQVKVDKFVSGTYTNVISGAVTYAAGRVLRLVCSGNSVSAYYNGTQVGSTVTVSDAGIVSNTRHGKFSTYASNTFAGYVAA